MTECALAFGAIFVFYQPFGLHAFIPTASCGVFSYFFHKIAYTIKNDNWKKLALTVINARNDDVNEDEKSRNILQMIDETFNMVQNVESDQIKIWLLANIVPGMAMFGRMREVLSEIKNIKYWDERYEAMVEVSRSLADMGLFDEAIRVIDEIKNNEFRSEAEANYSLQILDHHPEVALEGANLLLQINRIRGFEQTCETIANIIPVYINASKEAKSVEILLETYDLISKMNNWWDLEQLH